MNKKLSDLISSIGLLPPEEMTSVEMSSRASLYIETRLFQQAAEGVQWIGQGDPKSAFVMIYFKRAPGRALAELTVLDCIRAGLEKFMSQRKFSVRVELLQGILVAVSPWSQRNEFRLLMESFLDSESVSRAFQPVLEPDLDYDTEVLSTLHKQSRSNVWETLKSLLSRQPRVWQFSHFELAQIRSDYGLRWSLEFGDDIHLMEMMDVYWSKVSASFSSLELESGSVAFNDVHTQVPQRLVFRSREASPACVREFCRFLRLFFSVMYFAPIQDFVVTNPPEGAMSPVMAG